MKTKALKDKMRLNKLTIANLNLVELDSVRAGDDCITPEDPTSRDYNECQDFIQITPKITRTCGP